MITILAIGIIILMFTMWVFLDIILEMHNEMNEEGNIKKKLGRA